LIVDKDEMKVLLISNDKSLQTIFDNYYNNQNITKNVISKITAPFDVLAEFYSFQPSVILIDDDFLKPHTEKIIETIRKFNKEVIILFITSDTSFELGKKITPLGIYYYCIKPVTKENFYELLDAINNTINKKHLH